MASAAVNLEERQKNPKQSRPDHSTPVSFTQPGRAKRAAVLLPSSQTHLIRVFHTWVALKPQGEGIQKCSLTHCKCLNVSRNRCRCSTWGIISVLHTQETITADDYGFTVQEKFTVYQKHIKMYIHYSYRQIIRVYILKTLYRIQIETSLAHQIFMYKNDKPLKNKGHIPRLFCWQLNTDIQWSQLL